MYKKILAYLIWLFTVSQSFAVIVVERPIVINPFQSLDNTNEHSILVHTGGWAEFGKFFPEPLTDFNHFWVAKFGAFGEFYRYRNKISIVLFTDIEMIASSNSIIYFDPRAFYWQEGIMFFYREGNVVWNINYAHRCKHDIDNADLVTLYQETRARILIWDSLYLKVIMDRIELFNSENMISGLYLIPISRFDFYTLSLDEYVWYNTFKYPVSHISYRSYSWYSYDRVAFSVSIGGKLGFVFQKNFEVYLRGYIWLDLMGEKRGFPDRILTINRVVPEHYLEVGISLVGDGFEISLFVENNFKRETGIEPFETGNQNYWHFGIKAIDKRLAF